MKVGKEQTISSTELEWLGIDNIGGHVYELKIGKDLRGTTHKGKNLKFNHFKIGIWGIFKVTSASRWCKSFLFSLIFFNN